MMSQLQLYSVTLHSSADVPVKLTAPAFEAMLFELTLQKTQTCYDGYSKAMCYIDVIAEIAINP